MNLAPDMLENHSRALKT